MTETDVPNPQPEPARRRSLAPLLAVLLVVAAVAALGLAARRDLLPHPAGAPVADDVAQLRQDVAALRQRVEDLEGRPSASPPADVQALAARLAALESGRPASAPEDVKGLGGRLAQLEKTAADAASLLHLADRVGAVEAKTRDLETRHASDAAMLLAVGQLRNAVDMAGPFDPELRAAAALAAKDAEALRLLEMLKPRAGAGIPVRATLTDRFTALEPAIIRAEMLPDNNGWWRQTLDRLMRVVTIRREDGNAEGGNAAAVAARAQAHLARGDLAAAAAECEQLTEGAARVAAPWLDDARARLTADRALSELTAHAVAALGARK
jgi:hypothetical protein